jgi:hypothetical protein
MSSRIHPRARTTPKIRQEIKNSGLSSRKAAKVFNVTRATALLRRLKLASPLKISKILTDNGSQFTDRFATKYKKPSGKHAFDLTCAKIAASIG